MLKKVISVIGAGKMGGALIEGLLKAGLIAPGNIIAADKDRDRLKSLGRKGIRTMRSNAEAVKAGEIIILAVKPRQMEEVLEELAAVSLKLKLFISIAAGLKTTYFEKQLGKVKVIRVMPNTPALVAQGMSVISLGRYAGRKEEEIARLIFSSVGEIIKLPETKMDVVTALSGSGPAYFFFLMECLQEAGQRCGLEEKTSLELVLQVAKGAALLAGQSHIAPAELRAMVTSPGGTTEAAFKVLERAGVKKAFREAVRAAEKRSQYLSRQK